MRSRIVLAAARASGTPRSLGGWGSRMAKWRRFAEHRLEGSPMSRVRPAAEDQRREGRGSDHQDARVDPKDATHWSTRSMAKEVGLTSRRCMRIWKAFGLQPHRQDAFKLSKDPLFIEKVRDIVGLYLTPPERAVVLCVDEKSQIQALDRTAPILPMLPASPSADPRLQAPRHLEPLRRAGPHHGQGHRQAARRHARSSSSSFCRPSIARSRPSSTSTSSSTTAAPTRHRRSSVADRAPPVRVHFTPTSSSWLNLVERWFAELTTKKLRRGAHRSVRELNADIRAWIEDLERRPQALRLDQDRRPDPRLHRPLLPRINKSRH